MIQLSVAEVVQTLQARVTGLLKPEMPFPAVSIDSRTLAAGDCFVAICGERLDGHDFLEEALSRGASVVVHSRPLPAALQWEDRTFFRVRNTTAALQILAHYVRRKWGRRVIAITGSMGKTTTRAFAATLLAQRFRVLESSGNLNNRFGLPLSLLKLSDADELAVVELGMSRPGEILELAKICAPEAALLTNVAAVHLEFFPDLDAIAAAKGEILQGLSPAGHLFFNADDPRVCRLAASYAGARTAFGVAEAAQVRLRRHRVEGLEKMSFEIETPAFPVAACVPFVGRHLLYNIVAAVSVAVQSGLSRREVEQGISRLTVPGGRGRIRRLRIGSGAPVLIWDDSYNSNPEALRLVLETVRELPGFRRKILALGEMRELGAASRDFHRAAGRQAAASDAALLVTVGPQAAHIDAGARSRGFPGHRIRHCATAEQAGALLAGELAPGDFLLLKGSRGVGMEAVLEELDQEKISE